MKYQYKDVTIAFTLEGIDAWGAVRVDISAGDLTASNKFNFDIWTSVTESLYNREGFHFLQHCIDQHFVEEECYIYTSDIDRAWLVIDFLDRIRTIPLKELIQVVEDFNIEIGL